MTGRSRRPASAAAAQRASARSEGLSPAAGGAAGEGSGELEVVGASVQRSGGRQGAATKQWGAAEEAQMAAHFEELVGGGRAPPAASAWRTGASAAPSNAPPRAGKARPVSAPLARSAGGPRSVAQLEEALRGWLQANRRLHESRRVTLVRALMAGADVGKNASGVPLVIASPEAMRGMGHHASVPSASDFARELRSAAAEDEEELEEGEWEAMSEAERYAHRRQLALRKAATLRGETVCVSGVDIPLAAQPSAWRPEGGSWGPPPVKQSYAAELGEARHGAARRQRQPDALRSLSLSGEELAASWAAMGDPLRAEEVAALLDAHGADGGRLRAAVSTSGHACGRLLRVSSLVDAVLAEQFRGGGAGGGAAEALRTHHGIPAVPEDFRCRIKYRPARGTVLAPTRFDAAAALAASKAEPEHVLQLEHCHGYAGHNNAAPNLFLTRRGQLVYYAAALGVVATPGGAPAEQPDGGGGGNGGEAAALERQIRRQREAALERARDALEEEPDGPREDVAPEDGQLRGEQPRRLSASFEMEGPSSPRSGIPGGGEGGAEEGVALAGGGEESAPSTPRMTGSPGGLPSPARLLASPELHAPGSPSSRRRPRTAGPQSPARLSVSMESMRRSGRPVAVPAAPDKACPHVKAFREEPPRRQAFFRGHADDVTCVAMHPNGGIVASGELGREPAVCIWSADSCAEKARIVHEEGSRSIVALGFSGGRGRLLATVTTDNQHMVRVYDWAVGRRVAQGVGQNGAPPQVYGVAWDWHTGVDKDAGELRFATWGAKHLKVWEQTDAAHTAYTSKACSFGKAPVRDVFLASEAVESNLPGDGAARRKPAGWKGLLATGHANGEVYLWAERCVVAIMRCHESLPRAVAVRGSGTPATAPTGAAGVRCIALWQQGEPKHPCGVAGGQAQARNERIPEEYSHNDGAWVLAVGSEDGAVRMWDLGFEDDGEGDQVADVGMLRPIYIPKASGDSAPCGVRAIDISEDGSTLYAGTHESDVWAFTVELPLLLADRAARTPSTFGAAWYQANALCDATGATFNDDDLDDRRLIAGASQHVHAVAFHPKIPEVYALGCAAPEVLLFHSTRRHNIGEPLIAAGGVQSLAFSNPDGRHIAAGLVDGGLQVFDRQRQVVAQHRHAKEPVFDVKYSPSGRVLAAADGEQAINLYSVKKRYARYARCTGHSSSVKHIDFSTDGAVLQSVCDAYELMYWDVRSGRQLAHSQRDQRWSTWTAKLGFPVMGIWPSGSDGSDINSVCADQERGIVAATDDYGNVRLYAFPCVAALPGCDLYRGHASHVEMARFSPDGTVLVSVGGADCAALQWRVMPRGGALRDGVPHGKAALEAAAATGTPPSLGSMAAAQAGGRTTSIAEAMLSRGREGTAGYVRRRMAEMQRALAEELAAVDRQHARRRGKLPQQEVQTPAGKVWGAMDPSGRAMGWVDAAPTDCTDQDGSEDRDVASDGDADGTVSE
eukprot:jgi/Tetstr1/449722/TSEL_036789.t1